jgi:hypothetical protein
VLDIEEGDMAVRLALGETQLIAENKDYFKREGTVYVHMGTLYMHSSKV